MNQLTFKAKVVDVFDEYRDKQVRTHVTFNEGFMVLYPSHTLNLTLGQQVEITIAPLHDAEITCEHGDEVESDGAGSDTDAHVGDGAQPKNSPAPVVTCDWCDLGLPPTLESIPTGEVIWAHWVRGICHPCPNNAD